MATREEEEVTSAVVVMLSTYAGRLLKDVEDTKAGHLVLANLELGINSI